MFERRAVSVKVRRCTQNTKIAERSDLNIAAF